MRSVAAAVVVAAFVSFASAAEITKDSLPTVKKNVEEKKAVLVDVREKAEWDRGHVEGSILLPLSDLQAGRTKQLPKDKIVYTFCVVGKRAVTAGNILERQGYEVRALKPGYKELIQSGFPQAD